MLGKMMGPYMYIIIAVIACIFPLTISQKLPSCSREEYNRCVSLADPLLREPHLVFPDNMQDIELVCLTWNQFVDCLKSYTDRCFTPQQRRQFNKAVENPIESVHQMCTQRNYQQEYLQHAGCIKSTVTKHQHCGDQYTQLVQQVQQGDAISRASLCCSHDKFKRCVMQEAKKICDRGQNNGQAVRFAGQIIDKALSFLQDQCYNYIPNSGDCNHLKSSSDELSMSTASWPSNFPSSSSDLATLSTGVSPLEVSITNTGARTNDDEHTRSTDISWLPTNQDSGSWRESVTKQPPDLRSETSLLGSRTRPSSYGRSSSWDTPTPTASWATPSPTQAPSRTSWSSQSRQDWSTISTWHVQNSMSDGTTYQQRTSDTPRTTTETWYPAAGSHVGNELEEPNQLGLSKPKNGATKKVVSLLVIILALVIC